MFVDRSVNINMPTSKTWTEPPAEVMQELTACPICKSENIEELMADIESKRPTTYWSLCLECSHVFSNPVPSVKWINAYYNEGYRFDTDDNEDPEEVPGPAVQAEARRGMRQAMTLMRFTDTILRMLDIGSSSGVGIASTFDRFKVKRAVGVEPNHCYRTFAEKLSSNAPELPGKVTFVEKLSQVPKSPKFDFIHNSHVLEHVNQPVKMLVSLKQYLTANGFMYVEVPYIFGGYVSPILFPHLHAFNEQSLTRAVEEAGFFVHHMELVHQSGEPYWPSPRHLFAIVKKKPPVISVNSTLDKWNKYRFHLAYIRGMLESKQNPMAKFG